MNELSQFDNSLKNDENTMTSIGVPSTFGTIPFAINHAALEFKGKKILYQDVIKVAWNTVKTSVNFIPTMQTYTFLVGSQHETIKISFSAPILGGKKQNVPYGQLVAFSNTVLEPIVIKEIVHRIFDKGETVSIGSLHLNQTGYFKTRILGGIDEVLWRDVKYKPTLQRGAAHVWKNNGKVLISVPMTVENAVILPELIMECIKKGV